MTLRSNPPPGGDMPPDPAGVYVDDAELHRRIAPHLGKGR